MMGMLRCLKTLGLIGCYMLIVAIGIYGCCHFFTTATPSTTELRHLLTTASLVDAPHLTLTAPEQLLDVRPFHRLAAAIIQFIGTPFEHGYSLHTYRSVAILITTLFLAAIPALGLKRRGGLFATADAPFWALAFCFVTPAFFLFSCAFTSLSFQGLLFLAMLISARAYVQWPSYLSAGTIGFLAALAILIEPDFIWVLLCLIPVFAIGVGWRRILLYWHTSHILTLSASLFVPLLIGYCSHINLTPTLPFTFSDNTSIAEAIRWRVILLCSGGFSLLAWLGLSTWCAFHPTQRWERILCILFPLFFLFSFAFERGGVFVVPIVCLSPLLLGLLLATIQSNICKVVFGGVTLATLLFAALFIRTPYQPEAQPSLTKEAFRTIHTTLKQSPKRHPVITLYSDNQMLNRAFQWYFRNAVIQVNETKRPADFIMKACALDTLKPNPNWQTVPLSPTRALILYQPYLSSAKELQ